MRGSNSVLVEESARRRAPALFMDRDGVINVDHGYVHDPDSFTWIPGVFETVRVARSIGLRVVVTNQAGIGRGYYSEAKFRALSEWMARQFAANGAPLSAVYFCPYHRDALEPYRVEDHPDRKPNPGMLLRAAADLDVVLAESVMLGDTEADIQAGRRAGVLSTAIMAEQRPLETAADRWVADHGRAQEWLLDVCGPAAARST